MQSYYAIFQDIYEQSDVLKNFNQVYQQIESGDYQGSLLSMTNDEQISVHIESSNCSMLQEGVTPSDQVCIGVMQQQSQDCFINGIHLSLNTAILFPPNTNFNTRFNGATQFMLICFPAQLILDDMQHCPSPLKTFNLDTLKPYLSYLNITHGLHLNHQLTTPFDRKSTFDEIILRMQSELTDQNTLRKNSRNYYKLYCKFHEWILAHIHDKISIESASYELGVSRRHLEVCFKAITGMSPQKYIYLFKLNTIREILKTNSSKNITEIAHEWHLPHLGRFSQDYKQLFGELPSKTMKKMSVYSP